MASSKNLSDKRLIDAHEDSHHHCSAICYRKENNEQHEKGKQQCSVTKIFNPQFALIVKANLIFHQLKSLRKQEMR